MKKIVFVAIATLALSSVHADYTVTIPLNHKIQFHSWSTTTPLLGDWMNIGNIYSCSNWSPNPSTVTVGEQFNQLANDCKQDQERSVQKRETDAVTGTIRNVGAHYSEYNTITVSDLRQAIGSMETWLSISPTYTNWVNSGIVNNCTNWSPAPSSVTINESFTQTATDCVQPQTRYKQEREQETTTLAIRDKGAAILENQNIAVSSTRQAAGTKETWSATTSTYTAWVNNGSVTSCSNWSPSPATVTIGQSFTQTATDCQQAQTRSRQDREQETTTGAVRNTGAAVTENQTITTSSTRSSTGTKETWVATTPTSTAWVNSGSITGCSNWTPDPSTVASGTSFTQTATNCSQSQTRTTQNRDRETTTGAIRNNGAAFTETQSVTVSSTRTATGTKIVQECNGTFILTLSTSSEMKTYGPTKMTAYWAGSAFYVGKPQNFSYGGYNYVLQSSTSGGGLCRSK